MRAPGLVIDEIRALSEPCHIHENLQEKHNQRQRMQQAVLTETIPPSSGGRIQETAN